jgi:hypothetical protein
LKQNRLWYSIVVVIYISHYFSTPANLRLPHLSMSLQIFIQIFHYMFMEEKTNLSNTPWPKSLGINSLPKRIYFTTYTGGKSSDKIIILFTNRFNLLILAIITFHSSIVIQLQTGNVKQNPALGRHCFFQRRWQQHSSFSIDLAVNL